MIHHVATKNGNNSIIHVLHFNSSFTNFQELKVEIPVWQHYAYVWDIKITHINYM